MRQHFSQFSRLRILQMRAVELQRFHLCIRQGGEQGFIALALVAATVNPEDAHRCVGQGFGNGLQPLCPDGAVVGKHQFGQVRAFHPLREDAGVFGFQARMGQLDGGQPALLQRIRQCLHALCIEGVIHVQGAKLKMRNRTVFQRREQFFRSLGADSATVEFNLG